MPCAVRFPKGLVRLNRVLLGVWAWESGWEGNRERGQLSLRLRHMNFTYDENSP